MSPNEKNDYLVKHICQLQEKIQILEVSRDNVMRSLKLCTEQKLAFLDKNDVDALTIATLDVDRLKGIAEIRLEEIDAANISIDWLRKEVRRLKTPMAGGSIETPQPLPEHQHLLLVLDVLQAAEVVTAADIRRARETIKRKDK